MSALHALAKYDSSSDDEPQRTPACTATAMTLPVHDAASSPTTASAAHVPSPTATAPVACESKRRRKHADVEGDTIDSDELRARREKKAKRRQREALAPEPAATTTKLPAPVFSEAGQPGTARALRSDWFVPSAASAASMTPLVQSRVSSVAHDGRVRSFAHVEGQWATHIFLPIKLLTQTITACSCAAKCPRSGAAFEELRAQAEARAQSSLQSLAAMSSVTSPPFDPLTSASPSSSSLTWRRNPLADLAKPVEGMVTLPAGSASFCTTSAAASLSSSVHVSLSRTVVLKHHQIDDFVRLLKESLRESLQRPPLQLLLHGSKLYFNDERTRCFAALLVWPTLASPDDKTSSNDADSRSPSCPHQCCSLLDFVAASSSHALLLRMIARIDSLLLSFGQPTYYNPPELHATVSWSLPPTIAAASSACTPVTGTATSSEAADVSSSTSSAAFSSSAASHDDASLWCACECDRVIVSIGNRIYTLPFRP